MPAQRKQISCPPNDVLGQLVSGSLQEEQAEELFQHIDDCTKCQQVVDTLSARAEGVLDAVRKRSGDSSDERQLSKLIRKAQQLGRSAEPDTGQQPVPVESFVSGLRRCGLFQQDQIDSILSDIDTRDSSSIAKVLVSQRRLTPFQARVLLKGRWKGLVLGNYVLLDKLGQGGMGSVFKAKHRRLGRTVCVKVMNSAGRKSPQMMERFRNEAKTVAALSHPNFVVAHDADEAEGVPFLVMEYIEGSDLAKHVAVNGPVPVRNALQLIRQAAVALQYAHDQGVTHRDIKPHNLLLSEDTDSGALSVKILDMGLARFDSLLSDNPDASTHAAMTNTGVIMGTVDYMSPEQALRSRDADGRSDIYSLGCTLHFLLTGSPVFDGDTIMARLIAHRETAVPSLEARLSEPIPQLDNVFRKMLAKDPTLRYQSMQKVAKDVDAILNGRTPAAEAEIKTPPQSILEKTRRRRTKSALPVWATIAGIVAAFGLGAFMMSPDETKPPMEAAEALRSNSEIIASADNVKASVDSAQLWKGVESTSDAATDFLDGLQYEDEGGKGRALLLVSVDKYDDTEFEEWRKALTAREVNFDVVSTRKGKAQPLHDPEKKLTITETLQDVRNEQYDIIALVNGNNVAFSDIKHRGLFEPIVRRAVNTGTTIAAGSAEAFEILNSEANWNTCSRKENTSDGLVNWGGVANSEAHFVWTKRLQNISTVIDKSLDMRRLMLRNLAHADTFVRGGNGRALVILPKNEFHTNEWMWLKDSLLGSEASYEVVSSEFGEAVGKDKDKHGSHPKIATTQTLAAFETKDYDFVFVVGGNHHDFWKSPVSDELRELFADALNNSLVVAATSESGRELLGICEDAKHARFKYGKDGVSMHQAPKQPGAVGCVKAPSQSRIDALVRASKDKRRDLLFGDHINNAK